jgi:hypothetical protein
MGDSPGRGRVGRRQLRQIPGHAGKGDYMRVVRRGSGSRNCDRFQAGDGAQGGLHRPTRSVVGQCRSRPDDANRIGVVEDVIATRRAS